MPHQGLLSQITRNAVSLAVIHGIHQLADTVRANGGQPLDLILPDGSRVNFGLQPCAVMSIRDPGVLPDLPRPTLGALGEAFVELRAFGDQLTLDRPAAVKTGTSKAMRDNWCVGFTDRFTVGVWVGNLEGDPMRAVSGTARSARSCSTRS